MHEIDVWLDGKALSEAQLSTLKVNLQQSFKLSETQARLLVNNLRAVPQRLADHAFHLGSRG